MLLQFTFKNYKSFKDETTLDMIASSIKEHESDVAVDAFDERVLKVVAIFGANASGKSNVFKAFEFMVEYVKKSLDKSESRALNAEPFAFSAQKESEPSSFEVIFSAGTDIFQYGFTLRSRKIHEEYLYKRDKNTKKENYLILFYRTENGIEELSQELSSAKELLELLNEEVLTLTMLSNFKFEITKTVYQWFKQISIMDYGEILSDRERIPFRSSSENPLVQILLDVEKKKTLEQFIQAIDTGIEGLDAVVFEGKDADNNQYYAIVASHKNIDDDKLTFSFINDESSGTRKLISLYVYLEQVLETGGVLFADELDAKLHPLLLRYLINMFHDPATNPNNAQLIFTTHDVFTLDKDNFRRDEIWFVDKDERGVSDLYSLAEYKQENGMKTRNDASYGKDYILGKYNAIPNLKKLTDDGEAVRHGE
ncbi:ATP-binding protein [Saccharibacillus sp. CPCC 101409]|uniref:AAA family ATPase n=1 Tax=Saccharibacillus sp. CPCC 101409 TaxID=3058041 RepID=UPI002671C048|nr:ATP-binding protein [Saccharibacillus sp. CPCC 101409]MDO3408507.1 ATP-binding protein [Saccharibacillus sp. CPCC 101409]